MLILGWLNLALNNWALGGDISYGIVLRNFGLWLRTKGQQHSHWANTPPMSITL